MTRWQQKLRADSTLAWFKRTSLIWESLKLRDELDVISTAIRLVTVIAKELKAKKIPI